MKSTHPKQILMLFGAVFFLLSNHTRAKGPFDEPPPIYTCHRVSGTVTVDGKLTEPFWKDVPPMRFGELVHGGPPWFDCYCKVVWDDKCLYVAFWGGDPDAVASVGRDVKQPKKLPSKKHAFDGLQLIMCHDPLFMAFIDPGADGRDYVEIHINALNNVNHWWIGQGSTSREIQNLLCQPSNLHMEWECEGLQHAVYVYGTLNDSSDTDVGWSAELAVPFKTLKQFTKGSIPPKPGNMWAIHAGWEYRPGIDMPRIYWTWPVIGVYDDHQLWRYGKLVFSDSQNYRSQ